MIVYDDIDSQITEKVDLSKNHGRSSFRNLVTQQHHNAFKVFYKFLGDIKPARIIEIGTAHGGFTQYLRMVCDTYGLQTHIVSYDIHERGEYAEIRKNNIEIRVENIFTPDYSNVKQEVIDFIQQDGTTLVLCDGGNKIKEFNCLSSYIKPGDYIMAHDYVIDSKIYRDHYAWKLWNWHEISESDITGCSMRNNLRDHQRDVFNHVAWVCKKRGHGDGFTYN